MQGQDLVSRHAQRLDQNQKSNFLGASLKAKISIWLFFSLELVQLFSSCLTEASDCRSGENVTFPRWRSDLICHRSGLIPRTAESVGLFLGSLHFTSVHRKSLFSSRLHFPACFSQAAVPLFHSSLRRTLLNLNLTSRSATRPSARPRLLSPRATKLDLLTPAPCVTPDIDLWPLATVHSERRFLFAPSSETRNAPLASLPSRFLVT